MRIFTLFLFSAAALCTAQFAHAQFAPLDEAAYGNTDDRQRLYYRTMRTHYESSDANNHGTVDCVYEGGSQNYNLVQEDAVSDNFGVHEEYHHRKHYLDHDTVLGGVFYSNGKYFGSTSGGSGSLPDLVNAYLDGEDISEIPGDPDGFRSVEESHSATSSLVTITETTAAGTTVVTYGVELDGAYTPGPINICDNLDRGEDCSCQKTNAAGMPYWFVTEPYINLWIKDTPASYTTSLGEQIDFQINYKQRDTRPLDSAVPVTGWNHNWYSYVQFMVPTYALMGTSTNTAITARSPRGMAVRASWVLTNVFNEWSAILHAPDNAENYFDHGAKRESSSGLKLMALDGVDSHIYPYSTENPAGSSSTMGFRLVHPDGSQDIYSQVTALQGIWGKAQVGGRVKMCSLPPGDPEATYEAEWSEPQPTDYSYEETSPPSEPVGYLAGAALLTQRIDPYGNSIFLSYSNNVLTHITDYDGKVTTFSYKDGLLSGVDMPYGKSVALNYNAYGLLTNIVDAEGMSSFLSYTSSPTNIFETNETYAVTALTTPYGTTAFEHIEMPYFVPFTNSPIRHTVQDQDPLQDDYTVDFAAPVNVFVGRVGGTNRINRACRVTHPNGSKDIYLYRNDSSQLSPTTYPSGQMTSWVSDDGNSTSMDAWLSSRNSFHWNRKQSELLSTTNLANLTSSDLALATMSHWLAQDDTTVSDTISMMREPSPDGYQQGHKTWFEYFGKPEVWKASPNSATATEVVSQVMPDGHTAYTLTYTQDGIPVYIEETYTKPDGTIGTRTRDNYYMSVTASDVFGADTAEWTYLMPSSFSTPLGTWSLSDPVNHTSVQIIGGVSVSATRPRRLQLILTDPIGYATTNFYNMRQQLTGIARANGLTTTNFYGTDGFLSRSVDVQSANVSTFSFTNGLLRTSTNSLGLVLKYSWDKLDRLTGVAFPDGTTISNTYNRLDLVGQKDRLNHWSYAIFDVMDELVCAVDARGNTNLFSWCMCGALEQTMNSLGQTTTFNRNNAGQITSIVAPDNITNSYHRNILGQVTNMVSSTGLDLDYHYNIQGLVTAVSNPTGSLFNVTYDIGDRPIYVTDAQGVSLTNSFDALGRVLTRENALNFTETFAYGAQGLSTRLDALGRATTFGYDPAGRLAAVTNANAEVTQFGYDSLGDLVSLTDGRGFTKRWRYDSYGRQITETNANGVLVRTNGYDANGRLAAQWTAAKGLSTFGYDANGNLTSVVLPHDGTMTYNYDKLDRLTNFNDALGSTVLGYTFGLLTSENGPWSNDTVNYGYTERKLTSIGIGSWALNIGYDGALRPKTFSSPAGGFTNSFNGAGRQLHSLDLPGGRVSLSYDPVGDLVQTALTNAGTARDLHVYDHDPVSLITNVTRLNGVTATYGYDPIGQLVKAQAFEANSALRKNENLSYVYDASGNLAFRTNNTLLQSFRSDALNELTNVLRSANLTISGSVTGAVTTVSINSQLAELYSDGTFATPSGIVVTNPSSVFVTRGTNSGGTQVLLKVLPTTLPESVNLTYDLNGNLLSDGLRAFNYDDANQLTNITVAGQWKSDFAYDGLGRRRVTRDYTWVSNSWLLSAELRYVYDGMVVLQERDAGNSILVTYTRGLDMSGTMQGAGGIGGLLARTDANGSAYYHSDAGGNITAMVNSSGAVVARYLYDPYGRLLGKWGPLADANRYRFSSKEWHANSDLYYHGFRFYEPNLQRWLNRDPIGERGGINLYAYVGNTPINYFDPFGLTDCAALKAAIARTTRSIHDALYSMEGINKMFDSAKTSAKISLGISAALAAQSVTGLGKALMSNASKTAPILTGAAKGTLPVGVFTSSGTVGLAGSFEFNYTIYAAEAAHGARNTGAALIGAKEAGSTIAQETTQDASKTVQRILDPYGRLADVQNELGASMSAQTYQTIKNMQGRLRGMMDEFRKNRCK